MSSPGACEALAALAPDPERDHALLIDWCVGQGHTLLDSPPLFPVVRDALISPGLRADLLLLTETGTLVAVLIDTDPLPSPAPALGAAVATSHYCATLNYNDLEELYNSNGAEPVSLHEAHRNHFGGSPGVPALPSQLNRSHLVLLIVPHGTGPDLGEAARSLAARSLPVVCAKYGCFQSGDDTILVIAPLGEVPLPMTASVASPGVASTVVGDLAGAMAALDSEIPAGTATRPEATPAGERSESQP